jgi:hypothetical protein
LRHSTSGRRRAHHCSPGIFLEGAVVTHFMHRRRNTDIFARLHDLGDRYSAALAAAKDVSSEIEHEIEAGMAAGHSLPELSEASGLSVSQIEYIRVSVDVQSRLESDRRRLNLRSTG